MLTRQKRKLLASSLEPQNDETEYESIPKRQKNHNFVIDSESDEGSESDSDNSNYSLTSLQLREEAMERLSCPVTPLITRGWGDAFGTIRMVMSEIEGLRVPAMPPNIWAQWTIANPEMTIERRAYGSKKNHAVCDACGLRRDLTMIMWRKNKGMCVGNECGRRIDLAQRLWCWVLRACGDQNNEMASNAHRQAYAKLSKELCEGGYALHKN